MNADTYAARETLISAANRALMADRLDHSGAHDAAEQEYADDMLAEAAAAFTAALGAEAFGPTPAAATNGAAPLPPFLATDEASPYVSVARERLDALERLEVLVRAYATAHADRRTVDKISATSALRAAVSGLVEDEGRYVVMPQAEAERLRGLDAALDRWLFHVALSDHRLCIADARLADVATRGGA